MTYEQYDAIEATRWSTLKHLDGGPGLYLPEEYLWHKQTGGEDSDAMQFGRLFHVAVLEPDELLTRYVEWPATKGRRGTNEYKSFVEANAPKEVVTESDYRRALAVRDAVNRHPAAKKLLARKGERESVVTWTDEATGIPCKCRFDLLLTDGRPCGVDAKSTTKVDDHNYGNTIARFGYHGQGGFYRDGAKAALGLEIGFKHIAVASKPPHIVRVVTLSSDMLWTGSDRAHELLEKLAEYEAEGWPVTYPEAETMDLPGWYGDHQGEYQDAPESTAPEEGFV